MGSTGSGNFTDYQGYSGNNPKQGGTSFDDVCERAFRTELEDIDTSEYYVANNNLPIINSEVIISFNGQRIVALLNNQEIGNLPTKYNYLRRCMESYTYSGIVSNTSTEPINSIIINISPDE